LRSGPRLGAARIRSGERRAKPPARGLRGAATRRHVRSASRLLSDRPGLAPKRGPDLGGAWEARYLGTEEKRAVDLVLAS
jgi:hypothetical protein